MPARRPYASRGVPRRITTRRTGSGRAPRLFALLAIFAVLAGGLIWLVNPFAVRSHLAGGPSAPGPAQQPAAQAAFAPLTQPSAAGPGAPGTDAGSGEQTDPRQPRPSATPSPTLRRWDAAATGITTDPDLIARLDQALAGVDGRLSIAVKDLGSGRGAALDGDAELPAASLYKLPVLDAVFGAGLSMSEELTITDEARLYDSGTMELGAGETLTVSEALERMVTLSDNTSAVMLGSRLGGARVNATIAALGLEATHYSLERMTTSSLDMLHLLEVLARGRAVSPAASADMVHLLLRQRVNDRLPRLLPDNVQVAHKTGNLPGTVNDVGVLYGPSTTLAIAALISDTTDESAAATAIARLSLAAYTYFDAEPDEPGRPTIPPAPQRVIPPVWREPRPVPTPTPTVNAAVVLARETAEATAAVRATETAEAAATAAATSRAATQTAPTPAPTLAPTTPPATAAPTAKPTTPPATTATPAPTQPPPTSTAVPTKPPTPRPPAAATATPAATQVPPTRR